MKKNGNFNRYFKKYYTGGLNTPCSNFVNSYKKEKAFLHKLYNSLLQIIIYFIGKNKDT